MKYLMRRESGVILVYHLEHFPHCEGELLPGNLIAWQQDDRRLSECPVTGEWLPETLAEMEKENA